MTDSYPAQLSYAHDDSLTLTLPLLCPRLPGRDGTFRLWNGSDLRHFKTMSMGSSWITDCIYMASVGSWPSGPHPGPWSPAPALVLTPLVLTPLALTSSPDPRHWRVAMFSRPY